MADESQDMTDVAVQTYRDCIGIPKLCNGSILSVPNTDEPTHAITISSGWSQTNLEVGESRKFTRIHCCKLQHETTSLCDIHQIGFADENNNIYLLIIQPTHNILTKWKIESDFEKIAATKKDEERQFIEVWDALHVVANIDVKTEDKHGKIYEDGQFGCLSWSPDEKYLLYVAEKKQPKSLSFLINPPIKGDQNVFYQDWGELLTGKHSPVLCVADVVTGEIKVLGTPDHLSVGQALWSPDGKHVVFVGWDHEPYRLGLMYCTNRSCGIYCLSVDGSELVHLTPGLEVAITPRFNPQGTQLVFLSRDSKGPHLTCMKLMMCDWTNKQISQIIDVVDEQAEPDIFPGIFSFGDLLGNCWLADGKRLVLSTAWRNSKHIIVVNTEEKSVTRITQGDGCHAVLDVKNNFILAAFSTPNTSSRLMIACLSSEQNYVWTCLDPGISSGNMKDDISWKILNFLPPDSKDQGFSGSYGGILMTPLKYENQRKLPLAVYIHGGPHAFFPADFFLYAVCLCKLGYAVFLVNYRGSIGCGQKVLMSLPGNVGTQDVQDVQLAVTQVLDDHREILDGDNVFVLGGSHGGFLTAHLIGQYPDFYKAACLRNPVINMTSIFGTSDIPDWCSFEAGFCFHFKSVPSPEVHKKMLEQSPIFHALKVITPSLIMLGGKDLRVPQSQGIELYRVLKANGTKVRVLKYEEDSHPLNKANTEADAFMNIFNWFQEHKK